MSADQGQILNFTVLRDKRSEHYITLYASGACKQGIDGFHFMKQKSLGHSLGNSQDFGDNGSQFGHALQAGCGADNPADHSSELPSGNSTGNSANYASCRGNRWRNCFFVDYRNFLWYPTGCAQLAA